MENLARWRWPLSLLSLLAMAALGLAGLAPVEGAGPPAPLSPGDVGGCALFPADNIWNVPVDSLHVPADPNSDTYVATIGAAKNVHADFGAGEWPPGSGSPIGIPFVEAPGSQPTVPVTFLYDDESDAGPYPIPPDAPIEGGPAGDGDRHVLVVDRDNCILYELFNAYPQNGGSSWEADSGAIFDLKSNALRHAGWTSADAAGLPILPGLVRYDEVAAGEISHALRFTAPQTRRARPALRLGSDRGAIPAAGPAFPPARRLRHFGLLPRNPGHPAGAQEIRDDAGRQRLGLVHLRRARRPLGQRHAPRAGPGQGLGFRGGRRLAADDRPELRPGADRLETDLPAAHPGAVTARRF